MCHRRWHELIRAGRRGPTLTSVPVLTFASHRRELSCEGQNQRDTSKRYFSSAVELTFAMTIRGNTEANVKSTALAARFVDGPDVSAPDKAEQRLVDWMTDLGSQKAAAIGDLFGRFPRARTILSGIEEAYPYPFELVRAYAQSLLL